MKNLYLQQALQAYGFQHKQVEFIRHNENLTYNIQDEYLLRIHKPAENFYSVANICYLDSLQNREAEFGFLKHLREKGMKVQVPVPNIRGELVTTLSDGTTATVLHYLKGHSLENEEITDEMCYEIGQMTARLHMASKGYESDHVIPYDGNLCRQLAGYVNKEHLPGIDEEHREILRAACETMSQRLSGAKDFLMVHSDLSMSNLLATPEGIVPIDFSLLGYSHPMMDIGALFGSLGKWTNRIAIGKGYCSMGLSIDYPLLDVAFAFGILLYIVIHKENSSQERFQKNVARWCRHSFEPLARGERLLADDFYFINADE